MATCCQRTDTRVCVTEAEQVARQAHGRDLCENEPQNLDTDQPLDHSFPDHAQPGQPVYTRCELRRGRILGSRRILAYVDWGSPVLVLERARRMRWGGASFEIAGIRVGLPAGGA